MMRSKAIYYTVLNAAVSEWMDAAGDFPVDEDWNYLPEFLEYVNDCTPYTIENINSLVRKEFILSLVKRYRIIRTVWKNRISMSM